MASLSSPDPIVGRSPGRNAAFFAFGLLAVALAFRLEGFLANGVAALLNPYELDYGEGIVWQQMRMMFDGRGYMPIDGFPSIVFHYPPLYHAATHAATHAGSALGLDPLIAGRTVSLVSTLIAALLIGAITSLLMEREARRVRLICASTAAILALSWFPVLSWAPLMRVDMLACALSLAGLLLAIGSLDRPGLIYPAALLFVAAVYTKQTMIAAPTAAFGTLLLIRPGLAARGIATAILMGLSALALLTIGTDGGFIRHVFLYNVNRFEAGQLLQVLESTAYHAVYMGMAAIGVFALVGQLRASVRGNDNRGQLFRRIAANRQASRALILLAYLAITTPMLITSGKVGSSVNYQIEWMFALSIFAGISLAPGARALLSSEGRHGTSLLHACLIPGAIALQSMILLHSPYSSSSTPELGLEMDRLGEEIQRARQPIISDNMVLLLKNKREVVWEPAIFAELASTGVYDEKPFVRKILNRDFAFFVTFGDRGDSRFDERYNPAVADAIDAAYPVKQLYGNWTVRRPRP